MYLFVAVNRRFVNPFPHLLFCNNVCLLMYSVSHLVVSFAGLSSILVSCQNEFIKMVEKFDSPN